MSVRLIVAALLAAAIATAEPSAPKKALTVKSCNDASCNCGADGTTKYVAGECKEKDGKYWRLDSCTENADATLTSFFTDDDCKGTNVQSEDVKQACTAQKYIKARCDTDKVKLSIECPDQCGTCGKDLEFTDASTCLRYDGLDLYFKVTEHTCTEDDTAQFTFLTYSDPTCEQAVDSSSPSIELNKEECTPFIHKKATCSDSTATIQKCYGKGEGECTTCTTQSFTLKDYTDYNDKVYYIDKCPAAQEDLTFRVFETSKKPMKKTIHPNCQEDGASLHTMGTCADDAPPADPGQPQQNPPPKDVLTMKSECAKECKTCKKKETYAAGECKAHGDKYWRLEKCPESGAATVTSFFTDEDCKGTNTETVKTACTAQKYIKAVCAEQKVKLLVDCPAECSEDACKKIEFTADEECKQYENREMYFKVKKAACEEGNPETVKFELYTKSECAGDKVAALPEIDLTVDQCTPFVHKQASCENTAATIQECYGNGAEKCTSCTKQEFNLKEYTDYNDKVYYIDKCPAAQEDLTFKVFETSKKPVKKTINHECTGTTADQYTTSTCGADAAEQPQDEPTKDALTVVTECNKEQCADEGCKAKSYKLNECVEEQEGSNKVYYKATCGDTPTLHKFTTKENCNQNQSPEDVALPKTTCEEKDSKYQRVMCPEGDDATPKKPIITVKKSCTDAAQCTQCDDQNSEMYIADGTCQEQIVPPAAGAETNNAAPTKTSYIAECDALTLTTFTDAKCMEGKKIVQLPKTCTKGSVAMCSGTTTTSTTTSSTAKSDNDNDNGNDNGSGDGSGDGKSGSDTTGNTTSNDSGIDAAPAAHSVGAAVAAFVLLALAVVC